jgi:penicillin-binding protein 1C
MRDNWCVGYSEKYTVGVWVGNFSGEPMWNVSGVTGAAPIWIEMMNWLHRDDGRPKREPPARIVRREIDTFDGAKLRFLDRGKKRRSVSTLSIPRASDRGVEWVDFPQGTEPSREEWFIQGTEPHSKNKRIGQFNQRIVYPPSGTVIALDPDIPPELQKIFFISQANEEGLRWVLNGHTISRVGSILPWTPEVGTHALTLCDRGNEIIDSVNFEVRGPSDLPPLPIETVSQYEKTDFSEKRDRRSGEKDLER